MTITNQSEQGGSAAVDLTALSQELGLYTAEDTAGSAYARLMILGAPKIGKSTAIATTAPRPGFLNCDGDSALKFAAKKGASYVAHDVTNRSTWILGQQKMAKAVAAGLVQTVIVDTVTLLADSLLDDISLAGVTGFERYGQLAESILGGVKRLFKLNAHVILVAHMVPNEVDAGAGVVPLIAGQAKIKIPALAHDCALFELDLETGKRSFALGPQRFWSYSGRNIKRSCVVEPTVPAMFAELGIAL